ncbi:ferrous iron transport protein B [Mycoplasma sp. SG1]|uniref:ferrous iron transport protein B n=1 Tax=Mycoplasma sp. SG1 TaxID=2810348 RepID=UPI00202531DF|nr:ferrous iron transport protein B [Mycoplasma sp. SG1]URM52805.1 ferrous iron transport protein B [Mycoplasma sp. SG1]
MKSNKKKIRILFVGNPNVGKSSIINEVADRYVVKVANYPGVTVAKKVINLNYKDYEIEIIDTPGIYDFNNKSLDQKITANLIEEKNYDLIINVIDGTSLHKCLYLTQLIRELNVPFVVLINHFDLFKNTTNSINIKKFEQIYRTKALFVSGLKSINIDKILPFVSDYYNENIENIKEQKIIKFSLYDSILNNLKNELSTFLVNSKVLFVHTHYSDIDKINFIANFYAIRYLENNKHYQSHLKLEGFKDDETKKLISHFEQAKGISISDYVFQKRINLIKNIVSIVLVNKNIWKHSKTTLFIDRIILNKWLCFPLLLLIFSLMFILVFNIATPFKDWLDMVVNDWIGGWVSNSNLQPDWLKSFIVDGVLAGAGTVVTFLPIMICLFFFISVFQQAGYLGRISFIVQKFFSNIGLGGKSVIGLFLGFGCNVGSIFSTRIIENKRARRNTALTVSFVPCSARLAVFVLFASAFFGKSGWVLIMFLYVLGVVTALFLAFIFNLFQKRQKGYVPSVSNYSELPNYQLPSPKVLIRSSFIYARGYLKRASTIILLACIILWVFNYFPNGGDVNTSILSYVSKGISYVFYPLGFGHIWQLVAAIFPALIAKESTIGALGQLLQSNSGGNSSVSIVDVIKGFFSSIWLSIQGFSPVNWLFGLVDTTNSQLSDNSSLSDKLKDPNLHLTTPMAISYMVFMLLTIPCITTIAAIRTEFNFKTAGFSLLLGIVVPFIASAITYWICVLIF